MKTRYLLSALAISAAFVACDKDEMMMVNDAANTNGKEIVGADLLGTGLSINIGTSEGSQTRATATGWALGDVAGLGWVVKGNPFDSQAGVELADVDAKLFNNHYYAYQGDGAWNTQGNIYKGWHFAYFPYQYHEEVMPLTFTGQTLNPTFKTLHAGTNNAYKADITSNSPHISAASFLDYTKVNTAAGTIDEQFAVERIVNVLLPILNLHEDFKKAPLGGLTIEKVKLVVGKAIFPTVLNVNPAALPENVYTDGKFDVVETRKALIAKLFDVTTPVLEPGATHYQSVTTNLEEGMFTLGNTDENNRHWLRMFMPPAKKGITTAKNDLYFEITVEGGHKFIVDATQEENVAAVDKLFDLTKDGGLFRGLSKDGETITPAQGVQLYLNKDNFVPNFVIDANNSWENCVGIVDALGYENPTFTIADGYAVEFGDAEKMLAPASTNVTVKSSGAATIKIVGKTTWNERIKVDASVTVQVGDASDETINANASLAINDESFVDTKLVNYATIEAGKVATIGKKATDNFTNNGTVIIQWGSFVYPAAASTGDVAFRLRENDGIVTVNTLLSSVNLGGSANVNMFIVANRTWNLDETLAGVSEEDNRYNPVNASSYDDLSGITVVIEGEDAPASVVTEKEVDVKNVIMKGAQATLTGVVVVEDVKVVGQGAVDIVQANRVETDGDASVSWMIGAGGFEGVNLSGTLQVEGDIDATGNVNIGSTNGSIINAINVNATSVKGDINATGDVVVKTQINGDVTAKSVKVEEGIVKGTITATNGDVIVNKFEGSSITATNGNVTVKSGDVSGNIIATGNVDVAGTIAGSNVTGANITAEQITADVKATGNVTVTEGIVGNVEAVDITAKSISGFENTITASGNVTVTEGIVGDVVLNGTETTLQCASVTGNVDINANSVTAKIAGISEKLTVNGTKFTLNYTESVVNIKDIEILTSKNMTVAKNTKVLVSNIIKVNTKAKLTASASGAAVLYGVDLTIEGTGSVVGNVKMGNSF